MTESSDSEKNGVAVDGTIADGRSIAEGQVFGSEDTHASLNNERRYGELETASVDFENPLNTNADRCCSTKARLVALALPQHDVLLQFHRPSKSCNHPQAK